MYFTVPIIVFHCGDKVLFRGSLCKVKSVIEKNEEHRRVALKTFVFAHHIFIMFSSEAAIY